MASRVCLAMFGPSRSRQNRRRKADRQVVGKVRQQYLRITASSSSVSSWLSILPEKKNFVYIHTLASLTRIVIMHNIKQWILILKNGNILKLKEQLHKIFAGLGICSFAHKILLLYYQYQYSSFFLSWQTELASACTLHLQKCTKTDNNIFCLILLLIYSSTLLKQSEFFTFPSLLLVDFIHHPLCKKNNGILFSEQPSNSSTLCNADVKGQGWASIIFKRTFRSLRSFPFFIK